ncbi:hypothetical protein SUGI_0478970 [Cryptomeria japonica]|nr:hypothetical protein SUGI_0478970 [Cryptomeria japonica]
MHFTNQLYFQGEAQFSACRSHAESFVCSLLPGSPIRSVCSTPGGLLYVREGANTQYVTSAVLLLARYSDLLSAKKQTLSCGNTLFKASDVMGFAKLQEGILWAFHIWLDTVPNIQGSHITKEHL